MLYAQLLVRRMFARMGEFVVMQQLNQIGNEYKTKKKMRGNATHMQQQKKNARIWIGRHSNDNKKSTIIINPNDSKNWKMREFRRFFLGTTIN